MSRTDFVEEFKRLHKTCSACDSLEVVFAVTDRVRVKCLNCGECGESLMLPPAARESKR